MTAAPFEIIRIALQDLTADATADQALVAHYQAAGVNASPVMVQRHDDGLAYTVISGHEVVSAMQAAGLTWCWCLVIDAGEYQQERALVAAAEAAPEAAPAPKPARKARKAAPKAAAKAATVKELKAKAKAAGVRGYSRMTKAQLLALLGG